MSQSLVVEFIRNWPDEVSQSSTFKIIEIPWRTTSSFCEFYNKPAPWWCWNQTLVKFSDYSGLCFSFRVPQCSYGCCLMPSAFRRWWSWFWWWGLRYWGNCPCWIHWVQHGTETTCHGKQNAVHPEAGLVLRLWCDKPYVDVTLQLDFLSTRVHMNWQDRG